MLRRLREAGVRILRAHRVVEVGSESLVVVHAGRHRPVDGLVSALRAAGVEALVVGDARVPRLVEDAIRSGYEVARSL